MRYADSSASYGYDSSLLKGFMVTIDYRSNRLDSLGHSDIGQEYQSGVRNPSQVDQLTEVLVHCDENPVIYSRLFQQSPVARVRV